MELYQLRTFTVVAEEGHLTRAAERLFISQPAVSAHIKALESEVHVKLFRRTAKGMELTREGEALLPKAEAVLAASKEFMYLARAMGDELVGNCKLALNTDVEFLKLNALLACMAKNHPRVAITLLNATSMRICHQVSAGNWDAGFTFTVPGAPDLAAMPLFTFKLYVAGNEQYREAMQGAAWDDLAKLPWIWTTASAAYHRILKERFARENMAPAQAIEADADAVVRNLFASGKGLALLRQDEIDGLRVKGEVNVWPEESYDVQCFFVYQLSRGKDPLLQAVRKCVAQVFGVKASPTGSSS